MNPKAFYILWNPSSALPPRVRFESRSEASRVATQMTNKTGEKFFVMKAVQSFEAVKIQVTTYGEGE